MLNVHNVDKYLEKQFSCLHVNCRSIKKNFSSLESFLHVINNPFCAIGITETWLRDCDPIYDIDGFKFMGNNRVDRRGGGVGIYVRDDLVFKQRVHLDINVNCMESIFIEIQI